MISAITLIAAGSVNALTLSGSINRTVPFFQKLFITSQGDQSSDSSVELSGSNGQLIKIATGTASVVQAPLGLFIKIGQVRSSALAPDSIGTSKFMTGTLTINKFSTGVIIYLSSMI